MVVLFGPEGFEDGDNTFPNWTSYGGDVNPDVQQVVVNSGSWASIMALTTGQASYLRKSIAGAPATMYLRTYFRVDKIPAAGQNYEVFGIYDTGTLRWITQILLANYVDPATKWIFAYYDDVGGLTYNDVTTPLPAANAWYCIEQRATIGAAGTGVADLWINGVQKGPWGGITNNAETISGVYLQVYVGGVSGTVNVYFDDVVAATTYNGPLAESPAFGTFLTCLAK